MNLTLLTDLYQLTMLGGYFANNKIHQKAVFDLFFRRIPHNGGFCISAGLEQAVEYITNLHFDGDDIDYLQKLRIFDHIKAEVNKQLEVGNNQSKDKASITDYQLPITDFFEYLREFKFTGDLWAVEEGTIVFPNEPILRITATLPESQLIESALLNIINFQTLIATKSARVCISAGESSVLEFGLRRAQGIDGAMSATRAAYIGGCEATSNVLAGKKYGIPVRGTQAHSWVMSFPTELEAFESYANAYPDTCLLLVDTYDTLKSGVPNAIKVGLELEKKGHRFMGIRLDSGDLAYLSKEARKMLDNAGLKHSKIVASNDLDEWLINDLRNQGAKIDIYGVGTNLVTSKDSPALGGVYKLVAIDENGRMTPKIKISGNVEKITTPGIKQLLRIFDEDNIMMGDILILENENFEQVKYILSHHPTYSHDRRVFENYKKLDRLLIPIIQQGKVIYNFPTIHQIREKVKENLKSLRDEHKRLLNPDIYWVGLSDELFKLRENLINKMSNI